MSSSPRSITKVVIPAAGLGTRLRPATKIQPKEMLPVARKPTIQYVVEEGIRVGLYSVLIITGARKRAIEDHFDKDPTNHEAVDELDYEQLGVRFFFVRQSEQRGLADAISLAEEFVAGEPFVVALGDTILWSDASQPLLQRLVDAHVQNGAAATVAVERVSRESVSRYGIVAPKSGTANGAFELTGLVEKPDPDSAPSNYAIASRYVFAPQIFDAIRAIKQRPPGKGGEFQLTDAIQWLLEQGHAVWAVQLTRGEKRYDIGNFETYWKAFIEICLSDKEFGERVEQHLRQLLERRD